MDSQRQSTTCSTRTSSSSRLTLSPSKQALTTSLLLASSQPTLYSPQSSTSSLTRPMVPLTLSPSFSTTALNSLKQSWEAVSGASFLRLSVRAFSSFSMLLSRQQAMQVHLLWSSLNRSSTIWLRVEHFAWFFSRSSNLLLLSFLPYCQPFTEEGWQLTLVLTPELSPSITLVGDRFFIRNCCREASYSRRPTLGERTGETFIESFSDPLVLLLLLLLLLMKLRPWPQPVEFRIDCLSPNWVVPGVTPGAYIYPVQVIVYLKNYSQSILKLQSLTRILLSSFYKVGEIRGQSGMTTSSSSSIFMSFAIDLLQKGHFPNSIWQRTTPTDQMSAFMVQISPLMTSGAMQMGEPSMVWASSLGFSRGLQKPKSAILRLPPCMRMLSGLISRCMMLFLERTLKASTICRRQMRHFFSGRGPSFWRSLSRVPPLQNSQTKQKLLAVLSMSMYLTMQGQDCRVDRMLISFTVHSQSFGIYRNFQAWTTLMATSCLVTMWTALQTFAQTPSPSCYFSSQFSIILPIQYYQASSTQKQKKDQLPQTLQSFKK